ncbi:hypothetical protein [Soonwooa sp.]|uniref:hypothetical protein n=1 Tax=Soonwooa sp. TaxID=1938592 RepID=UPI0028B1F46C|nr:hypothetical protein [Soonwooa sp.]
MKKYILLFIILQFSVIKSQIVDAKFFNKEIKNSSIRQAKADTIVKSPFLISSIKVYTSEKTSYVSTQVKKIQNKNFYPISLLKYQPDGKIFFSETYYNGIIYQSNFYYQTNGNLILKTNKLSSDPSIDFSWLSYDKKSYLDYELSYEIKDKNKLRFQGLMKYKKEIQPDFLKVDLMNYSSDSLLSTVDTYTFFKDKYVVDMPVRYARKSYYSAFGDQYLPYQIDGYYVEGRTANFSYNDKGFPLWENWVNDKGLENRTEYLYNADFTERITQQYQMLGTEKSTKFVNKFNKKGDPIFKQTIEYTGNPLDIYTWDYVYDEKGNWIESKKYWQEVEKGIPKMNKLVEHIIREIKYYNSPSEFSPQKLPAFDERATQFLTSVPAYAEKIDNENKERDAAIKAGDYVTKIPDEKHVKVEDFTPKYWTLKKIAYGNLDDDEQDEAVAVYETPSVDGDGDGQQILAIYKKDNGKWRLWHQNFSAIMSSDSGGMMGNPFDGVSIKNKAIVVMHSGGSRDKWSYTHRYRFQSGDWYLIGALVDFGAPQDYFGKFDYNLSTGDIVASYKYELSSDKKLNASKSWSRSLKKKIPLPKMDDFYPGGTETVVNGRTFYW